MISKHCAAHLHHVIRELAWKYTTQRRISSVVVSCGDTVQGVRPKHMEHPIGRLVRECLLNMNNCVLFLSGFGDRHMKEPHELHSITCDCCSLMMCTGKGHSRVSNVQLGIPSSKLPCSTIMNLKNYHPSRPIRQRNAMK